MKTPPSLEDLELIWTTHGPSKALECLRDLDLTSAPPEDLLLWIELEALILYSNSEFLESLKCLRKGIDAHPDSLNLRRCFKEKKAYTKRLFMGWAKEGNSSSNFYEHLKSFIFYSMVFYPQDLLDIFTAGKQSSRDLAKEMELFEFLAGNNELYKDFLRFNKVKLERMLGPRRR